MFRGCYLNIDDYFVAINNRNCYFCSIVTLTQNFEMLRLIHTPCELKNWKTLFTNTVVLVNDVINEMF